MISKMSWIACALLLVAAGLFAGSYYRAGAKEWELLNRVPTSSVEDSKRLGVYVTNLNFSPAEVDLGDTRYKIEEVWVEHRTDAERVNFFTVRQKNYPDLALCVRTSVSGRNPALAESGVGISTTKAKRTYGPPFRSNMCVDAGETVPAGFVLSSVARGTEVHVELKRP